jgi:hypothetical protein
MPTRFATTSPQPGHDDVASSRRCHPEGPGDVAVPLTTSATPARRAVLPDAARHLSWDGSDLVLACDDGRLLLQEPSSKEAVAFDRLGPAPTALATCPGRVAVGGTDGTLLDRSRRGRLLTDAGGTVTALTFVGDTLAVAARRHILLRSDGTASSADPGIGTVTGMAAVSGRLAAVVGTHGLAWLDTADGVIDGRLELPTLLVVAVDPRRRCVALGELGGSIHLVAFGDSSSDEITGYPDRVESLTFTSDGNLLCTTAADELTAWPVLDDGRVEADEPRRLLGHDQGITTLAAASTGGLVATGDTGGGVLLWRPGLVEEPIGSLTVDGVVIALAWRADGRALAVTSSTGALLLVDVEPGEIC